MTLEKLPNTSTDSHNLKDLMREGNCSAGTLDTMKSFVLKSIYY